MALLRILCVALASQLTLADEAALAGPVEEGPFWSDAKPYKDTRRRRTRRRRTYKNPNAKDNNPGAIAQADADEGDSAFQKMNNALCQKAINDYIDSLQNALDASGSNDFAKCFTIQGSVLKTGKAKIANIKDEKLLSSTHAKSCVGREGDLCQPSGGELKRLLTCAPYELESLFGYGVPWWAWIMSLQSFTTAINNNVFMSSKTIPCKSKEEEDEPTSWKHVGGLLGGLKLRAIYDIDKIEDEKRLYANDCELRMMWFWENLDGPLADFIETGMLDKTATMKLAQERDPQTWASWIQSR